MIDTIGSAGSAGPGEGAPPRRRGRSGGAGFEEAMASAQVEQQRPERTRPPREDGPRVQEAAGSVEECNSVENGGVDAAPIPDGEVDGATPVDAEAEAAPVTLGVAPPIAEDELAASLPELPLVAAPAVTEMVVAEAAGEVMAAFAAETDEPFAEDVSAVETPGLPPSPAAAFATGRVPSGPDAVEPARSIAEAVLEASEAQPQPAGGVARAHLVVGEGERSVSLAIRAYDDHVSVRARAGGELAAAFVARGGELRDALRRHGLDLAELSAQSWTQEEGGERGRPQQREAREERRAPDDDKHPRFTIKPAGGA